MKIAKAFNPGVLKRPVAYFSMEFGLKNKLPIFSGGLGILAGDTLKSAADLGVKMVGVGLLWRNGYVKQKLTFDQGQVSETVQWDPENTKGLSPLGKSVKVQIEDKEVAFRLWRYDVVEGKSTVPLILLDSACPENEGLDGFKDITRRLYRNHDPWWRITQEMALGIGGMRALKLLYPNVELKYHLNEGHAAMAPVEFMLQGHSPEEAREHFTGTTHTPVPAGHDRFHIDKLSHAIRTPHLNVMREFGWEHNNPAMTNMTILMMNLCRKINAVAKKHLEVTRRMFPSFDSKMTSITNGIHPYTWASPEMAAVFDKFCRTWRDDPEQLRFLKYRLADPDFRKGVEDAHRQARKRLIDEVNRRHPKLGMVEDTFTIGFARRAAGYKRADLIFADMSRLFEVVENVAQKHGNIQIIFAGKAHFEDGRAADLIKKMLSTISNVNSEGAGKIKVIYLENHDMELGKLMVAGSDVWLNTPLPPFEASGTSGMKAAVNGVPQISTFDGWWCEGYCQDNSVGWMFGSPPDLNQHPNDMRYGEDSEQLYKVLEKVAGIYYANRPKWVDTMINAIALNGSYFNTHRMLKEYVTNLWF
ncbi:MAG: alpha-glucan family phosphorylase [bacterium]